MLRKCIFVTFICFFVCCFATCCFCGGWILLNGAWFYQTNDGEFYKNGWYTIDGNKDGLAEWYYFNKDGLLIVDDICPDYSIVNKLGQKLDKYGKVIVEVVPIETEEEIEFIQKKQKELVMGNISQGVIRQDQMGVKEGPKADNISNQKIIMKGVKLKEDETETASRKLVDNIVGGDRFEKSVNATVSGKGKWKGVMALNGDGAYLIFNNPGFKKIRGRVSHEYVETKNQDDTHCSVLLVIDDLDFSSIENFDYKKYEIFEFELPEECMKVKLQLVINGESTGRKVYLRDVTYRK